MSRPAKDQDELPEDLGKVDVLLQRAEDVYAAAADRDLQAAMGALRLIGRLEAHREKITAKNAAGMGDLSETELMARLEIYAARMPDPHLRIFADAYCHRLGFVLTTRAD